MGRAVIVFALIATLTVSGALGDYLHMIGWTAGGSANCTTLLSAKTSQQFNLNLTSDYSTCVVFSSNYQLYGNVECFSNGTAHANFSTASNCDSSQASQPAYPLVTKSATWGESQCWSGSSQVPNSFNAIMITCVLGAIPAPVAPSAPVAPVPVPQAPTTPTSTPTGPSPVPTTTPSTVPAPIAPVGPSPTSTPTPVSTTPPPSDPFAYAISEIIPSTAVACSASGPSFNVTGDSSECVLLTEGVYLQPACRQGDDPSAGWSYGFTCSDSACLEDCVAWPGRNDYPARTTWGEARCINDTAAGFAAICYPVYQSQVPVPVPIAPVPHTPVPQAPITPITPITPTPISTTPTAPVVTVDWSAQFGDTCGTPMFSGAFSNSTDCQTVYTDSVYAVAYCNAAGTPAGKICSVPKCNNDAACTPFAAPATVTWGKSYCVTTSQRLAVSLTCNNHTTPPAPTAPVAPTPPSPPPVSSGGKLTFSAFMDPACTKPIQTIPLVANISLCQQVTAVGQTLFMKADCYANGTVHGGICNKDSTCQSCTALPPAPSGLCVPYSGFNLVNAIEVTCPVIVPPSSAATTISRTGALVALCLTALLALIL